MTSSRHPSSFRDPAGYLFERSGVLLRQVSESYSETLASVLESGLHSELVANHLAVEFEVIERHHTGNPSVLAPKRLKTISYPYEWSFGQTKAAALATLEIQRRALDKGFVLKDASAYNIQFALGQATLIDTLSFERWDVGNPWRAYRQFCEHFLAPLALMSLVDPRLNRLMQSHLDGIPVDLASRMLPWRTRFSAGLGVHIHLHGRMQKGGSVQGPGGARSFGEAAMRGLVDSLKRTVERLDWNPTGTAWVDYYSSTNYSAASMDAKRAAVGEMIADAGPAIVWDIGANTGEFSAIAAGAGAEVVAWDFDVAAVEKHWSNPSRNRAVLPLIADLANPSPALGWAHKERASFVERCNADLVMALALIHHLAIGNNVPLERIASFFADLAPWLIVEFVPKEDSQVQRLLASRDDIYDDYHLQGFEAAFGEHFEVVLRVELEGTLRTLFLMRRKGPQ